MDAICGKRFICPGYQCELFIAVFQYKGLHGKVLKFLDYEIVFFEYEPKDLSFSIEFESWKTLDSGSSWEFSRH